VKTLSNFNVEKQADSRLCWSAVSLAIAKFYDISIEYSQIDFAKQVMGTKFNQFCPPAKAMVHLQILNEEINRSLTIEEIKEEISNNRPIAACMRHFVGWHLVVIYGFEESQIFISDSLYGKSKWNIKTFETAYQKTYSWTHTYTTSSIQKKLLKPIRL
jgi:hypothetical protein